MSSSSALAMVIGSGVASGRPATASTKDGATEVENCLLGRKRQSPVSSIQVRVSFRVRVSRLFWRILSARACANCSDVKEKPHFRVGVIVTVVCSYAQQLSCLGRGPLPIPYLKCDLNSMEGPPDVLPGVQQSYGTTMRATCWMLGLCKFHH